MYVCDICNREYKYKKNLKRHLQEKHSPTFEYWNCTEAGCSSKFIRKGYLFKHLHMIHHLSENTARRKAIDAQRGDIPQQQQYYEDISDDDTVLDLIRDLGEFSDNGEKFDVDNYLSSDGNNDQESQNNLSDVNDNQENADDDNFPEAEAGGNIQESMNYEVISSCDEEIVTDENNNDCIVISDSEEKEDSTVDVSKVKTKTQTLILTFSRKVSYIDGQEVYSDALFEQDYYEHFD